MNNDKLVQCAIETYDHLLWEAVIKVCGRAFSQSFSCKENRVRVVYRTVPPDCLAGDEADPRIQFQKIREVIDKLISLSLPIRKLGKNSRGTCKARKMCSQGSYMIFLENTIPLSKVSFSDYLIRGEYEAYDCDFVEVGTWGEKDYICCPCVGQHLENTRGLSNFKIDLQEPKRVGKGTYEFRFKVGVRATT